MSPTTPVERSEEAVIVEPNGLPVSSRLDWHQKAVDGASSEELTGYQLRKVYQADEVKALDDSERVVRFVISTSKADRHNDTVDIDGWDLTNYHKAGPGPVQWAHSPLTPSIAGGEVEVKGKKLVALAKFAPPEVHPFADTIYQLIKGMFGLKGTSVGFRPLKFLWNDQRGGYDFAAQELLEFSIVNVGANPDALRKAIEGGIDMSPLHAEAEKVLSGGEENAGLWLPKANALAITKALGSGRGMALFQLRPEKLAKVVGRKVHPEEIQELDLGGIPDLSDDALVELASEVMTTLKAEFTERGLSEKTEEIEKLDGEEISEELVEETEKDEVSEEDAIEAVEATLESIYTAVQDVAKRLDTLEEKHMLDPAPVADTPVPDDLVQLDFSPEADPVIHLEPGALESAKTAVTEEVEEKMTELQLAITRATGRVFP